MGEGRGDDPLQGEVSSIRRHIMSGSLLGLLAIVDGYYLGISLGVRKNNSIIPSFISWNSVE